MTAFTIRSLLLNGTFGADEVRHKRNGYWLAVKHIRLQNSLHLGVLLRRLHETLPTIRMNAVWTTLSKSAVTFEFKVPRKDQP